MKVATTNEIEPGQARRVDVQGKSIAFFNVEGQFFALGNTCTHRGGPLAARGESPSAFDERRILAACVAPPSNTGGILSRRALFARRLARLGATPDLHHGLLAEGEVSGYEVTCPWHGARFDVRTGEVVGPPAQQAVARYGVRVTENDVEVEM